MKVKHWAGYGCVQAICLHRSKASVVVDVYGNHEQGLEPRYFDTRDWERWLGKRFKANNIYDVDICPYWDDKTHTDHMEVTMWLKGE